MKLISVKELEQMPSGTVFTGNIHRVADLLIIRDGSSNGFTEAASILPEHNTENGEFPEAIPMNIVPMNYYSYEMTAKDFTAKDYHPASGQSPDWTIGVMSKTEIEHLITLLQGALDSCYTEEYPTALDSVSASNA